MTRNIVIATLLVIAAGLAIVLLAARLGLFAGHAPDDLGVRDGKLKAPSPTPNSVSSQAALWSDHLQREQATIAALPAGADGPAAIARIAAVIGEMPGSRIVEQRVDYLRVEFTTPLLRFVDDAEFWFDPGAGAVQVRSASRIGRGDLGANRERIEAIRRRLTAA